jgi:hypothetical protein
MSAVPYGPPPVTGSNPMQLLPDPGVASGVNLDAAPHEIPAGMGRFLKDVLLDVPGVVRQRGPLNTKGLFPSLPSSHRVLGMTSLQDPNGTNFFRILLLTSDKNSPNHVYAWFYGHAATTTTTPFHARAFFDLMDALPADGRTFGDGTLYFDDRRGNATNIGVFQLLNSFDVSALVGNLSIGPGANDPFFDAKLSQDGGVLLGIGTNFGQDTGKSSHRAMLHWRGASRSLYNRSAVTVGASSPTVTDAGASFLSNVEPGMFLIEHSTGLTLGVVKTVDSNTQVTLEQSALHDASGSLNVDFVSMRRPFVNPGPVVGAGSVTASTASAVINGGGTKFVDQGVANGDHVYRANDYKHVGVVSSVQSNIQLTLSGPAAVAMTVERYVIVHAAQWAAGSEPVMSAFFNGMQLLATADNLRGGQNERSRIFITDERVMEQVDLTKTGTYYDLPNTKAHTDIRGIMATESCALVFLAESTYGIFGTDPTALTPKVVHSDGALSPMVIQPWQGGAIWAGHRGVYFFDGHSVHNLLEGRASRAHQQALANIDYGTYRAWSMLHNGHYVCFLSKINPGSFKHYQGRATSTDAAGTVTFDPTSIIYSINLRTGALVFWTNINVRGYTSPPGVLVTERDAYYVVENAATGGPAICSAEALFQDAGFSGFAMDQVLSVPTGVDFAPHFYVEGRLNPFGDVERKKRIQLLLAQYSMYGVNRIITGHPGPSPGGGASDVPGPVDGGGNSVVNLSKLGIDVVSGMGEDTKAVANRPVTSEDISNPVEWLNKRNRFGGVRTGIIGVRFYTMTDSPPCYAMIGPWSFGLKPMRVGRA